MTVPNLGSVSTRELLAELEARCRVGGSLDEQAMAATCTWALHDFESQILNHRRNDL